ESRRNSRRMPSAARSSATIAGRRTTTRCRPSSTRYVILERPVASAETSTDGPSTTPARSSQATSLPRSASFTSGGQGAQFAGDVLYLQIAAVGERAGRRGEDVSDGVADDLDRRRMATNELELFAGGHHAFGRNGTRLQVVRTK